MIKKLPNLNKGIIVEIIDFIPRDYSLNESMNLDRNVKPFLDDDIISIDVRDHAGGLLGWKLVFKDKEE